MPQNIQVFPLTGSGSEKEKIVIELVKITDKAG